MKASEEKTNAVRQLEQRKIKFTTHTYSSEQAISGTEVAEVLGQDPDKVFKTLVTVGKSGAHYVFVVPVKKELDLKAAAAFVHEKSVEMIKSKELLPLTGYIHGGCSPIGMKKQFKAFIDESAKQFDKIMFSAGKVGYQVEVLTADAEKIIHFSFADLVKQ